VVVGTCAGQAVDAFGDAANIAARVQATAEPHTVVVTGATHRLISGLFVVEERGAHQLKGIERPVQLYRLVRPSGMRSRFEAAAAAGGLTAFVGREDELRSLLTRWERALDGDGQAVLIIGEAGIGKSRLVRRFHEAIAEAPHTWLEAGAGAFFQNTPFYPISETLRQFTAGDQDPIANLARRLEAASLAPAEVMPLLAPLLNLLLPSEYQPLTLPPDQQRRRLLASLVKWMLGSARTQPLVSVIEDLHWADPSTLELIQLLVAQGATAPLLLLYTARPEFHPPWPLRAHHTQLTLNRLSAREVRKMVSDVAARKALSDETIAIVVERTSGVPLFVEELTRAVLGSGDGKLMGRAIPVTLHDSLMARLDRLGPARDVAQIGAVIGAEFSYELLRAVHPIPEPDLRKALHSLTDAELLYVRGIAPDANYQFKHALIRDAAYEALLKSRRKEVHLRVARTIDAEFPALKEKQPEVLARHWTEAGETERSISAWTAAAQSAEVHSAFTEALDSYQRALQITGALPLTPERDRDELALRQSVLSMLNVTKGYAAPETVEAAETAVALAEKCGDLNQLAKLLASRGGTLLVSGDFSAAASTLDRALLLGGRQGASVNLAVVHQQQTIVRYFLGDLEGAEKHFKAWHALFDEGDVKRPALGTPLNMAVNALAFGSYTAWISGHANIARQRETQMLAVASRGTMFEIANSGYLTLAILLGEYERAEAFSTRTIELAKKDRLPNPAARARIVLGLARAHLGHVDDGVALIEQGISELQKMGTRMGLTQIMARLAEAQALAGRLQEAFQSIEIGLQILPDERLYRPLLLRLRGELSRKQSRLAEAEADLRESITEAQNMRAKAWELQATTRLARLFASHGKRDQAWAMLKEIYNWFTEGFDTADLKDAKALLDELAS
jgi:tetratricopeptide (TPR) repeat protein